VVFCDDRDGSARLADRRLALRDGRVSEQATERGDGELAPVRLTVGRDASGREIARLIDEGWHIVAVTARGSDTAEIRAVRREQSS
jgi:hypothetical protein